MNLLIGKDTPDFAKDTVYRFMKMLQLGFLLLPHMVSEWDRKIADPALIGVGSWICIRRLRIFGMSEIYSWEMFLAGHLCNDHAGFQQKAGETGSLKNTGANSCT